MCSRSCQTLITGQTLTPLVSYGGNAKSESGHFQDFKSLMVCKTRGFIMNWRKKGLLWDGSASSRPRLLASWILPWLILASEHTLDYLCFSLCRLLVMGERYSALAISPPVFSARCHKKRGKFSMHRRMNTCGFLETTFTVKLLERRIPANAPGINFSSCYIPCRSADCVPFWELR